MEKRVLIRRIQRKTVRCDGCIALSEKKGGINLFRNEVDTNIGASLCQNGISDGSFVGKGSSVPLSSFGGL